MKNHHAQIAGAVLVGLVATLGVCEDQTGGTPSDVFVIKGVAVDAKGPLARDSVIVMPIEPASGDPLTLHKGGHATLSKEAWTVPGADTLHFYLTMNNPALGERLNPEAVTNAEGVFSLSVRRDLLKPYKPGEIALVVLTSLRQGQFGITDASAFEPQIIKVDENASTIDLGRVVFMPARRQ